MGMGESKLFNNTKGASNRSNHDSDVPKETNKPQVVPTEKTICYNGNAKYHRSIGQNLLATKIRYPLTNGRFGQIGMSSNNKVRNIASSNPLNCANDFYGRISYGGVEIKSSATQRISKMADGSFVSMRTTSSSDGTPVVEINIKKSSHTGGLKEQKIHFIKEK